MIGQQENELLHFPNHRFCLYRAKDLFAFNLAATFFKEVIMKNIENLLKTQRKKLLDTSLRNPLLNYRKTSRAIEITSEWPEDIFHRLVVREKSMVFLPQIEDEGEKALETIMSYIDNNSDEDDPDSDFQTDNDELYIDELRVDVSYGNFENDNHVQEEHASHLTTLKNTLQENYKRLINSGKLSTNHPRDDLKRRLTKIFRDMQRFNKELGVNPFYITLGMLEWGNSKRSQESNLAPLLLIPVELTRKNRFANFEVQYTDEEVEINETLYEKLREDFDIQLPSKNNIKLSEIQEYFTHVEDEVKVQQWKVDRTKITLTVFASKKYLMHKDLKIDSWPGMASPEKNPTLGKLIHGGFKKAWQSPFQQTHLVDPLISPMDNYQIYDADSSQLMAIHHVKNGHDLIIQGPPGTGKSQTITNIIAQAIGDDKIVLFVAQKETALNVVKGKLDDAGLGQLCLELHGKKTKRGAFLNELQKTLDHSHSLTVRQNLGDIPGLIALRDKLNNYSEAINTPVDGETLTPFQCFEELLRFKEILQEADPPRWPETDLFNHIGSLQYHEWSPKIENLQTLLADIGMPKDNIFQFCRYSDDTFIAPEQTKQIIRQTQNALKKLKEASTQLTNHLRIPLSTTKRQIQLIIYLSEHILQAPSLAGVAIRSSNWQRYEKDISNTISTLRKSEELQRQYKSILTTDAWTRNIGSLLEQVHANSNLIQRFLNLPTRIPDELTQLCLTKPPLNVNEQLALLNAINVFQSHQNSIINNRPKFMELVDENTWHKMQFNWRYLSNLNNWLDKLHQTIQTANLPSTVFDYLEEGVQQDELQNLLESVKKSLDIYENTVSSLTSHLQLDEEAQFGRGHKFVTQKISYQEELLNTWFTNISQLKDIIDYNRLKKELIADGFLSIVELGEMWPKAKVYLADVVKYVWYLHLINKNREHNPELMTFNRVTHEANIQKFCDLDTALFEENKAYLASKYSEAVTGLNAVEDENIENQLKLIKSQCMNAGAKLSIRKIIENAGEVIQTLKPIFMMSPASVAEFLPPAKVNFDLVIFDEASQIRPEDATGAILRGNQTVVVGDRFQLPPTDFFSSSVDYNDDSGNVIDAESILDFFSISLVPETTLLWHYRSQHHSLITPSNQTFYNNDLIVFPSPKSRNEKLGIRFFPTFDSIYDRGGSRTNLVEARCVAEAAIHHAATDPDLSLGVVALHKNQSNAIEHEINILLDQHPEFVDFFEEEGKFFVTNLENVQGDEKEVIFISIGYGFGKDGRLTLNFGPISQEGGHKRLNVLTTRARKQCVVFSSIRGRDILDRNPTSLGAQYLAKYLEYAESGLIQSYEEMQAALYETEDYKQKHDRLVSLLNIFNKNFNLDEIKNLCFHLVGIDYENLSGDTKQSKARELAFYFHRRENINQLIQVGKQLRPEIDWGQFDIKDVSKEPDEGSDLNIEKVVSSNFALEDKIFNNQKHAYQISQQIEKEVVDALEKRNYYVERYVGPPNAAIPIAVMDEARESALLGIEFDGRGYYQSRSARDRDRLRREQLEKLNWKIHRIWIIDWYYNKEREINRLIQAINDIR